MVAMQEQKQINDLVEELELCVCNKRLSGTGILTSSRGDALMHFRG